MPKSDPTAAQRARRRRERERLGVRLVTLELEPEHLAALADWGLIQSADTRDRARLTLAVELLIGGLAARAVHIDFDAFKAHLRAHIADPAAASTLA